MTVTHSKADSLNPNRQFYVVGNQIIDPNGKVFVPIGANVGSQPNNFDWAGGAAGHSSEAQAWGWNTVRLTVYCTTARSYSRVNAQVGDAVLLQDVDKIVKEYTAKNIVVMVECHDAKLNMNDAANFWLHMGQKYKTNPYVWFNYANEPEWGDNDAWIRNQKEWLQIVRSTGAENIFVADVMNAGNDAGWAGAKKVYDPSMGPALVAGQCNVLMSHHNYGGLSNSQDYVMRSAEYRNYWQAVKNANLAMVVGEYGTHYNLAFQTQANGSVKVIAADGVGDPKQIVGDNYLHAPNGVWATLNIAKDYGIGSLVWHATFADNLILGTPPGGATLADGSKPGKPNFYNILNSEKTGTRSGYAFSQMGSDLWKLGHSQPASASFAGNYASSNCGSAKAVAVPIPTVPVAVKPIGSTQSSPPLVISAEGNYLNQKVQASAAAKDPVPANPVAVRQSTTAVAPVIPAAPNAAEATLNTPTTAKPLTLTKTESAPIAAVAGRKITAKQVSMYGSSIFGSLLVLAVVVHIAHSLRDKRRYAAHHSVIAMPLESNYKSDVHEPGTIIKPKE